MTSDNRVGVAVIGVGMASLPHGKSLRDLQDFVDVVGVYSPTAERREAFAQTFGFPVIDHLDAIINDAAIHTVLVLTPPNVRRELVSRLSAAGKHILLEKPVERSLSAAREIVDMCESSGVGLGVVFQHRFRDASLALAEQLAQNALGELNVIEVNVPWWREQSYYDEPGRGTLERDGGGVLISQAIHTLDLMLTFTGAVECVSSMNATSGFHQMECEDFVSAGLRFESGAVGSLRASTASYPGSSESIALHGNLGSALLEGGELTINFHDGRTIHVGESATSGGGADPMDFPHVWHQRLIESFLHRTTGGESKVSFPTGRSALEVHTLIEALVKSGSEKRWVSLNEFD